MNEFTSSLLLFITQLFVVFFVVVLFVPAVFVFMSNLAKGYKNALWFLKNHSGLRKLFGMEFENLADRRQPYIDRRHPQEDRRHKKADERRHHDHLHIA